MDWNWRTVAYFLVGFIFTLMIIPSKPKNEPQVVFPKPIEEYSVYDDASNERLIKKARMSGANWLLLRAIYNCTIDGELIGDDGKAEAALRRTVDAVHENEMKVFFTPFVESLEFWPKRRWTLSPDDWTEKVLLWARFAEENNVDLFAPGFEMGLIFEEEEIGGWYSDILPRIREVYSGRIAFVEVPYGRQWENLEGLGVLEGYDCVGVTVFPWKDYDGVHDIRDMEDLRAYVEDMADILVELSERYGKSLLVATLGMDLWFGDIPNATMRAEGYQVSLDVLKDYDIEGVFLHIWASEHDHLGEKTDVEEMLRERWTIPD
jgi:hypothetical protein